MLIHNNGYLPSTPYYPEQAGYPNYGHPAPVQMDNYYHAMPMTTPTPHLYYTGPEAAYPQRPSCRARMYECSCPEVPPHQSLLRQILTGQGYKNDLLFVGGQGAGGVKMEGYPEFCTDTPSSCCYNNIMCSHSGGYAQLPSHHHLRH